MDKEEPFGTMHNNKVTIVSNASGHCFDIGDTVYFYNKTGRDTFKAIRPKRDGEKDGTVSAISTDDVKKFVANEQEELSVDVWDWVVTKGGKVVQITADDMPELPYEEIKRKATVKDMEKLLKHTRSLPDVMYEFLFNDNTWESCARTVSIHRTEKGAQMAMGFHKQAWLKEEGLSEPPEDGVEYWVI